MGQSLLAIVFLLVFFMAKLSAIPITAADRYPLAAPSSPLTTQDSEPADSPRPPSRNQWQHLLLPRDNSLQGVREHSFESRADGHEKTVIVNVTTIIISQGPDPNRVYHDSDGANQKDGNDVDDPNAETVVRELEEDRAALRRLITILSVIGGVSATAVVVSILIFTRMRKRRRPRRRQQQQKTFPEHPLDEAGGFRSGLCPSPHSSPPATPRQWARSMIGHCALAAQEEDMATCNIDNSQLDTTRIMFEPSAPPAPFPATLEQDELADHQRSIVPLVHLTKPSPTAPSAKELDVLFARTPLWHGESSRDVPHSHSPDKACPDCEMGPDIPPPAYSPNAPPFFVLPSSGPLILSRGPSLPKRRHSQG